MSMDFIGVSGNATCGKDYFYQLLKEEIKNRTVYRIALADALKRELSEFFLDKFNIDIFNATIKQKNLIRPLMVEFARIKRNETKGRYFWEILNKDLSGLEKTYYKDYLFVITDLRFKEFEQDEYYWLHDILKGRLVYIDKWFNTAFNTREYLLPPNNEEATNNPKLKEVADYLIDWEHENQAAAREEVRKFIKHFNYE